MSGWLFKKKSITMHGNMNVKIGFRFSFYIICWAVLHYGFIIEILYKRICSLHSSLWKNHGVGCKILYVTVKPFCFVLANFTSSLIVKLKQFLQTFERNVWMVC